MGVIGIDLPRYISRLVQQLERGELEFSVNREGLDELTRQFQRMTNRLVLTILLGATIAALGLIMTIYHPSGWEQYGGLIFGVGFLFALGSGPRLTWKIWVSGRF